MLNKPRVLVACEESQRVTIAFRARGFEAYSCDILETSGLHPEWHIKDDVLKHLNDGWDLMIAHPPCTYLANSGVRWLHFDGKILLSRMEQVWAAADFVNALLNAPIRHIAVENPIQHKYARQFIRKYDQIIQPYQFGDAETKATCLWLTGLPKLTPTRQVMPLFHSVHREPPGPERQKNRSRTFQGIADSMADQWGNYLMQAVLASREE